MTPPSWPASRRVYFCVLCYDVINTGVIDRYVGMTVAMEKGGCYGAASDRLNDTCGDNLTDCRIWGLCNDMSPLVIACHDMSLLNMACHQINVMTGQIFPTIISKYEIEKL